MFVRKLILVCLTLVLVAPLADAKPAKPPKHHIGRSNKRIKKGPKAKWGSYKVKNKH
jgi:hypothetical protein